MGVADAGQLKVTPLARWSAARRRVRRIDDRIVVIEGAVASALTLVIVATVLVQVVMRYVFARPNAWTEELSRYAFIWLSLLGSSLAMKRGAHFLFESAVNRLAPSARLVVETSVSVLISAMLVGLLAVGSELAAAARVQRSPALDLPMIYVYSSLPVAAALMLLHLLAGRSGATEGEPGWASH